jgi:flagellar basal-body rod protein FlgF
MLYGMYVSAAGALANSYRQDVVANNLANVETVGFKRDLALFQARPTESARGGQSRFTTAGWESLGGGIFALPTHTVWTPAALQETGGKLDVGLNGRGFFEVRNGDQINYTRDGRFTVDGGQLVTVNGHLPVLDASGQPITLDRDLLNKVTINEMGEISQGDAPVARLAVVDVDQPQQLRKLGNNRYAYSGANAPQAVTTSVKQGAVEGSGVNPTDEMVSMIRTERMFEQNISMLKAQDQSLGLAVSRLGMIT